MSILKLAFLNFRRSLSTYLALILSLAFTVLILMNFLNLIYSDTLNAMSGRNKEYVDQIVKIIAVVLGCFMFFFIWYSTNVFLNRRKKEIGIYVFMGLDNRKIGKLYLLETLFTGSAAMLLGIIFGMLLTGLFQMILLAISELSVDLNFRTAWQPIAVTVGAFAGMYGLFAVKGYRNIVKSSVLEMIASAKQNEAVKERRLLLVGKAVLGAAALLTGYYFAASKSGMDVITTVPAATVFVIIGVYLIFAGFLPLLFQQIARHKHLLYRGTMTLWVNNVVFRMKKNYRAYAITCILMLCSVTALASGFAVREQYENRVHFRRTYTFQLLINYKDMDPQLIKPQIEEKISIDNKITVATQADVLMLDPSLIDAEYTSGSYAIAKYSQIKKLAEDAGLEVPEEAPKEGEVIGLRHIPVLSIGAYYTAGQNVTIAGKPYREIAVSREPYLGYLQELSGFFIVNDSDYEALLPHGEQCCVYSYQIADIYNFAASLDDIDSLPDRDRIGRIRIDPNDDSQEWIKVLYSLCVFLFLVFILASASILFMKLYNDAFEEKERFAILLKMGCHSAALKKAISREIGCAYAMPFVIMTISAYFSVHALEKMMNNDLMQIYLVSVCIVLAFFLLFYYLSVFFYRKNVGLPIT